MVNSRRAAVERLFSHGLVCMKSLLRKLCYCAIGCLILAGCGEIEPPAPSGDVSTADTRPAGTKQVDAARLPKLGDYLPPLDDGRVEIAPPAGWIPRTKSKDFLCAFSKEKGAQVPSIIVKVASPITGEDFNEVTPENVVEFAAALKAEFAKGSAAKTTMEQPLPMLIGKTAVARYVKAAEINNLPAEVQVLSTIRDGRMYTVELRVRPEEIKKYRDDGYAVVAGMKFAAAAKPFEFKPGEAAPEKPAEAKPAEAKPVESSPPAGSK